MGRRKKVNCADLALKILVSALILFIGLFFLVAVQNLDSDQGDEAKLQLEDALRRTAVACYASEGVYPPSIEYMEEHYGIQIDKKRYVVHYQVFASNIMPEITILEKDE